MAAFDEKVARNVERAYLAPEIVRQRVQTLEALSLGAGDRVLDIGCGPGLLVHDMALTVGPTGCVIGLDISQPMLDLAIQRCAGIDHAELREGNAAALGEADASLDAVACTQVLLYVDDAAKALAEMARVLKPGGRLAVLETDWRGAILHSGDHALTERIFAAWDRAVTNPNLPAYLSPLLRHAGFDAIRVEAIPIVNASYAPANFSAYTIKSLAANAVKHEAITEDEAANWQADLKRLGDDGAYFFCVNRFLFSAVKT